MMMVFVTVGVSVVETVGGDAADAAGDIAVGAGVGVML